MGLVLQNLQRAVALRRSRLRRDLEALRLIAGVQRFGLGVVCVDNRRMQRLNWVYRNQSSPTDVLSFPLHQDLRPGTLPCPLHRDELNLGDVFLGVEFVMARCEEESSDLYQALTVTAAHGICHLLGFRHETEEEWAEMLQRERYILNEYNRLTGSHLEPLTKKYSQEN